MHMRTTHRLERGSIPGFIAALAASALLAGCNGDEIQSCTEDFDCPVAQVCKADADGATVCQDAGATEQRKFGRVDLDFADGSEVYLVGVQTLPRTEASPDALATYTIGAPPSGGSMLRLGKPPRQVDPMMEARIAFESRRRAAINAYVEDLNAGRRSIRRDVGRQLTCPGGCMNPMTMCWQGSCQSNIDLTFNDGTTTVNATVIDVAFAGGTEVNVLLDQNDDSPARRADAISAVMSFLGSFSRETSILGLTGHSGDLDRDGDSRLTVVFTSETGGNSISTDVVGFFSNFDFLDSAEPNATGNAADILWVRVPGTTNVGGVITEELAVGTLVHEYVHLASYATRVVGRSNNAVQEVLWLDEAMAHTMEDLTGWGASNITTAEAAVDSWVDYGFATSVDSSEQRGHGYLLLRHMIDQSAGSGASSAASTQVVTAATTLFSGLISGDEQGWLHPAFQTLGADGVWKSLVGLYATNNTDVTVASANAFDYLPTGTEGVPARTLGFDPFGSFLDARGTSVDFAGVDTIEILDVSDFDENEVPESGNVLYLVSGLAGTVTLEATGDAQVDFRLHAQRVQ